MERRIIATDVLIVGGGTAGCFAARQLGAHPELDVLVVEKAGIERSGCLAAGVNAINAYVTRGRTPEYYADYAMADAGGIARYDLLLSMSERLNGTARALEKEGLVFLKDDNGNYAERGTRNVKINGENIKPLLAQAARRQPNVRVLEHVNITDLLIADEAGGVGRREELPATSLAKPRTGTSDEPEEALASSAADEQATGQRTGADCGVGANVASSRRVVGAVGFSVDEPVTYVVSAWAVLVATGGAAGLYRPNNPGFSRHKMWYPPFNTGAGYAMGMRAGAEMTSLEMRFIALRCKDTIAPTGTIAQGVGARQVNAEGTVYESMYGLSTSERVWGTVEETRAGRGPCYLQTRGIGDEAEQDLYRAYLNMAPAQTLRWVETGAGPNAHDVEIEGTEPYVVGGHTASGYWVDEGRRTTLRGLYAAGDAAGGAPQKYVTGALAEAELAVESIVSDVGARAAADDANTSRPNPVIPDATPRGGTGAGEPPRAGTSTAGPAHAAGTPETTASQLAEPIIAAYERHLAAPVTLVDAEQLEEAMQKIMDQYAGGISSGYRYNSAQLAEAYALLRDLSRQAETLAAQDADDLLRIYELKERLVVCRALVAHLAARKETRWHAFAENASFPEKDPAFECYVNSRLVNGEFHIVLRDLVRKGERLEHFHR